MFVSMKMKAKYCGCWNLKQKQRMLENLSRSDSICGERIELMFRVWMIQIFHHFLFVFK